MRLSLRIWIIATFSLLLASLCLVGVAAVSISAQSQRQIDTLEQHSLVPAVRLAVLSQSLDEERSLLSDDTVYVKPAERRAILNELVDLDVSISRLARQTLRPVTLSRWVPVWRQYLDFRDGLVRLMRHPANRLQTSSRYAAVLHRVSNRLAATADLIQSESGYYLYRGSILYADAGATDRATSRLTIVCVAASMFIGLLLALLIVRRLTQGLTNLTATAEALSSGHLDTRAHEGDDDELGVVARAFNHMTDALLTMEHAALTDVISGLGNHRAFQEALSSELARAVRYAEPLSLALIDLDDFKVINDLHGHSHGDRVLAELGQLLKGSREQDRAFRIGGDEFALLMPHTTGVQAAVALERLRTAAESKLYGTTLSIGIAEMTPEDDTHSLREQADAALYEAKRRGRNAVIAFEVIKAHTSIISNRKIMSARRLLAEKLFKIAFQPIWMLEERGLLGYEALIRPAPELDLNPAEAFDIAEKLGRGPELDEICRLVTLSRAQELPPDSLLFINLSPQSLDHTSLQGMTLVEAVLAAGLPPERVVLEITERSIARIDMVVREAMRLRSLGFQVALDDVGAGNAGLEMLRRLPVDFVKLDRSVVAQALLDQAAYAVLSGIVAFARKTNTFVIAEGIETPEMLTVVYRAGLPDPATDGGIQGAQGFLLGKPGETIPSSLGSNHLVLPFRHMHERRLATSTEGQAQSSGA